MKRYILVVLLFGWVAIAFAQRTLLPQPTQVAFTEGRFSFTNQTAIYTETAEQAEALSFFLNRLAVAMGQPLAVSKKELKKNGLVTKQVNDLPEEGYRLQVNSQLITIEASSAAGFFYATQSLMQLLPVELFNGTAQPHLNWSVPAVSIEDAPKYPYRGFMLDVARFFLPKAEVLRLLDYLAMHKINKFHWHLVDDNGWRIEIKKYPLLTTVGGYRVKREGLFPNRANPMPGEPTPVGGYYTQEEIKEVVAYAQKLAIEVIPEIEMPAHSNAALAAYPHLTCPVVDEFIGTLPGIGGKRASIIYCAGKEDVFHFLEDVVDEVVALFPSSYLHIGGDEAWKDNWEKCPLCQQRMKEENIPNEEELQSYFIRRMNRYIQSKGKKLMGWDELADSEIPEGATIFGWRGLGEAAATAAKQGHEVVLTPARAMYLIRYQGPQWFEPFTYFGNNTLKDVYTYEPEMSDITPALLPQVKGLQASMWTEFINSREDLHYMIFPRLAALADIAWSQQPKDWNNFLVRMDGMCQIYNQLDLTYARSMYNLEHKVETAGERLQVTLGNIRPDVEIRYTLDGTQPSAASPLYSETLILPTSAKLLAQTFQGGVTMGKLLSLTPHATLSTGAQITGNAVGIGCLVNGLYGSECYTDGEYIDLQEEDLEFTLQLTKVQPLSKIVLGTLINSGMGVAYPESIMVSYSTDGVNYAPLCEKEYPTDVRFPNGYSKEQIVLDGFESVSASHLRVVIKKPGILPKGAPREEQSGRMAFDEFSLY